MIEITRMDRLRWRRGMCQGWHLYGDARRRIYTHLLWRLRTEEQTGQTLLEHVWNARCSVNLGRHGDTCSEVLKDGSMKVETARLAFFCSQDRHLKGLCHCDDVCVVARRKQLHTFGKDKNRLGILGCCRICKGVEDLESNDQD